MKYKVGDRVKIRSDLTSNNFYNEVYFSDEMEKFKGNTYLVREATSNGWYFLDLEKDEYDWTWNDEMIECKVEDKNIEDKKELESPTPVNYMNQVAEMLGVKLGEKFRVVDSFGSEFVATYHLSENGLMVGDVTATNKERIIFGLLTGEYTVVKSSILLTKFEYELLNIFDEGYYITRDKNGTLCIMESYYKPYKYHEEWIPDEGGSVMLRSDIFDFIKWEDEEPYLVKDILERCEVEQ